MKRATICVDFDGVLHAYTSGWKGATVIPDGPTIVTGDDGRLHHAMGWLTTLTEHFRVVVCSARARRPWGWWAVRRWIARELRAYWGPHAVTADDALASISVSPVKPAAIVYIDDRAWRFDGREFPTAAQIKAHRPWCAVKGSSGP
ncbi:MAG TPA: hypothetical protein VFJ24_01610 [Gaiellales bacterium]|nr:hypothetical protein [Gaiellales bacterium]